MAVEMGGVVNSDAAMGTVVGPAVGVGFFAADNVSGMSCIWKNKSKAISGRAQPGFA